MNTLNNLSKLNKRHKRRAFNLWTLCTKAKNTGLKKLFRHFQERESIKKKEAIMKWANFVFEQDQMILLHGSAVRFGIKQYKSAMFYAWRQQATFFKTKRINL